MTLHRTTLGYLLLSFLAMAVFLSPLARAEDLPSWRDGATRDAIVDFVIRVTTEGGPDYVAPENRIATFDNDGTLWAEQPLYFQLLFALDRVRAMAPDHPEWKTTQPFQAALENDMEALMAGGTEGLAQLVFATHTGMSTEAFAAVVTDWVATAVHPVKQRPYTDLVYQPMLELLDYLRDHGFHTYITSGGGMGFMRPWVESVYGIPPEQVIGSSLEMEYVVVDGKPELRKLPELHFWDDKEGKPVAIQRFVGKRPIAAFGNSDGDFQMLEWTTAGDGARLGVYVHHTDADREWAYDRESHIGRLDRGLDEAAARGWVMVDMKRDWNVVFPYELGEGLVGAEGESMDESERILGRFVEDGRIHQLPAKQSKRLIILQWLADRFTAGVDYAELEVNRQLSGHEPDHVYLRRLLVEHGLLTRDHGIYQRVSGGE